MFPFASRSPTILLTLLTPPYSLQGENASEGKMVQDECPELDDINFADLRTVAADGDGVFAPSQPEPEPEPGATSQQSDTALPSLTPSTEESGQNIQTNNPQVISDPVSTNPNHESAFSDSCEAAPASRYPQRPNKGVPKKQYEPDPKAKVKYPIVNYVSTRSVPESYAFAANQLSSVSLEM